MHREAFGFGEKREVVFSLFLLAKASEKRVKSLRCRCDSTRRMHCRGHPCPSRARRPPHWLRYTPLCSDQTRKSGPSGLKEAGRCPEGKIPHSERAGGFFVHIKPLAEYSEPRKISSLRRARSDINSRSVASGFRGAGRENFSGKKMKI